MGIDSVIVWLIVGAIAGWLAGLIVKGGGFGLLGNIVTGIVGAVVAGWLLPQLGIRLGTGIVAAIINSAIGGVDDRAGGRLWDHRRCAGVAGTMDTAFHRPSPLRGRRWP